MRRTALLLYALIFVNEFLINGFLPLLPVFEDELTLSKVESGALLSVASVATLVAAIPAGVLADRLGARTLTLAAGGLLAVSALGHGLAPDFGTLLAARAGFGVASSILWTAGLTWLFDAASGRSTIALGGTVTVAGLSSTAGPAFNGLLAERFGVLVPLAAIGAAAALLTILLFAIGKEQRGMHGHQPFRDTLGGLRERLVAGSVALMALGGFASSVIGLLVPLQLDDNGLSEGSIGIVFSASAGVFIVTSALLASRGERAIRLRVGAFAVLLLGVLLILPVASGENAALVSFMLLRAPLFAALFTISFPLGALGAARAGIGAGAVMGLLNVAWGAATAVGPLLGGAVAQSAGEPWAYGGLVVLCLASATWLLAARGWPQVAPEPAE